MKRIVITILSIILVVNITSAKSITDSLKRKLQIVPAKNKLELLIKISEKERLSGSLDSAIFYASMAYRMAESLDSLQKMGKALNILGTAYTRKGLVKEALASHLNALKVQEKINDQKGLQSTYNGLGVLFLNNGDADKALRFLYKGLEISERNKDSVMMATQLYNIGLINYDNHEYTKALEVFDKAIRYAKIPKARRTFAYIIGTKGSIFSKKGEYSRALSYFRRSLDIMQSINESVGTASTYQSMGMAYQRLGNKAKALQMQMKSLKVREKNGYTTGILYSYNQLASILMSMDNYSEARAYAIKCYTLSSQLNQGRIKVDALENLFYIESQEGNCKKALSYYNQMSALKDSLNLEEIARKRIQTELTYKFEKELHIKQLEQEKKDLLITERMRREKQRFHSLIVVILLLLALAVVSLLNSRRKRRDNRRLVEQQQKIINQKLELEQQHSKVLSQQKEINDSICYAQRIQNALFPIAWPYETFPGAFAFSQPKNTIGGDFYWVMDVEHYKVAVVVDCTGHGVPGGFMSILGINFMNDIVIRNRIIDSARVLEEMRIRIIEALHQSELTLYSNDGMDMSIAILDTKTNIIDFASANGKALLYRKALEENSFTTLPVNRMPVCYYVRNENFTSHKIEVKQGDILFMYTDGITDQYGGDERQRKLGQPLLQKMLAQVIQAEPSEQEALLNQLFNSYKGKNIQYDDVMLLCIPF